MDISNCPKCKSKNFRKDGIVKSKQRYLCKDCKHRFTVEQIGKPNSMKRDALILYLEGLGFRSIGRFLNVSHVAVFNWIKSFGEKLDDFRNSADIEVVELDEMHTYIGSKKTTVGYGLLLIDMGTGSSIVKLAHEGLSQEKSSGKKLKDSQKE
jgi:transposase-like protein